MTGLTPSRFRPSPGKSRRLGVRLLGRLAVEVEDQWVNTWPRPAARRLVALLVLAPRHSVGREVLVERLFAHLPPERGLRNVSKALSQARTVLGPDLLEADGANVWIAEDVVVETDLTAATQLLEEAIDAPPPLELWSELRECLDGCGELLVDDAYEEWAREPLLAMEHLARQARLALARASNETGDWLQVVAHDPGRDEAWCALLTDCAQRADRTGLNRVFTRCRTAMATELGVEPSPRIRELYTSLRGRLAHFETPAATELTVFGRDGELDSLMESAQSAGEGRGEAVLVTGAAGIGKSFLLSAVTRQMSAHGYRLAVGTCVPDDATVPFASLRSALGPLLAGPERTGTLLGQILDPASVPPDTNWMPNAIALLADEVSEALDALADPVLVSLDDIHWADSALQALLVRLAAVARPRQWTLLLAARSDEAGFPLPPLPSRCHILALAPLDPEATAVLARHLLSHRLSVDPLAAEALVRVLVDRSAGNPFFLSELVRLAATGGNPPEDSVGEGIPDRVVALLRHRLAACPPASRDTLAVVALAGQQASHDLLGATLHGGFDGSPSLNEVIGELRERHLVTDHGEGPRLIHPLLRDAAVAELTPDTRTDLHRRIADALDALSSRTGDPDLSLSSATHRLAAFEASRLVDLAGQAAAAGLAVGGRAFRLFAPGAAARLLERALDAYAAAPADDRDRLREPALRGWLDLGNCQALSGSVDDARASYRRALEIAQTALERASCIRSMASLDYRGGRMAEAQAVLHQGLATLGEHEPTARAVLELEIAWTQHRQGYVQEAQPILEAVAELFEDAGDWPRAARALDRLAMNLIALGRGAEALQALDRAQAANGGRANHQQGILAIHRAGILGELGRLTEALQAVEEGASILERSHDDYSLSVSHWAAAQIHERRGDLPAALASRAAEIALLERVGNHFNLAAAHAHRAAILRLLGRHEAAEAAVHEARAAASLADNTSLIDRIEKALEAENTTGTPTP